MEDEHRQCIIDLLVANVSKSFFQPNINNKKLFDMRFKVPQEFTDKERLIVVNDSDIKFNDNTHKTTSFQEEVEGLLKAQNID